MKRYGLLAGTYVGLVILANWLASRYVVSVGFGRMAPAGVFCIGGVLVLRDWLQQLPRTPLDDATRLQRRPGVLGDRRRNRLDEPREDRNRERRRIHDQRDS